MVTMITQRLTPCGMYAYCSECDLVPVAKGHEEHRCVACEKRHYAQPPDSKRAQKKSLFELRAEFRRRLAWRGSKMVRPMPEPRYDEVFEKGMAALEHDDDPAPSEGRVHFKAETK